MNYAYFYIVGQNIGYFTLSWRVSLFIVITAITIGILCFEEYGYFSLSLILGWMSCLPISESKEFAHSNTYSLEATTHMNIILHFLEMLIFAAMTMFVFADDSIPILWVIVTCVHLCYIYIMNYYNEIFKRINIINADMHYFLIYCFILLSTDLIFLTISLFSDHRVISIVFIMTFSLLTYICTYLITIKKTEINKIEKQ
jgi:hypothetical protein